MEAIAATWGVELAVVAAVGGLGWFVACVCLVRKFDRHKDRPTCLVSDVIGITFATVTFFGVISIALTLPDIVELARKGADFPSMDEEFHRLAEAGALTREHVEHLVAKHVGKKDQHEWEGHLLWHSYGERPVVECYFGETTFHCMISDPRR